MCKGVPELFLNNNINLTRLIEIIWFTMNRTTTGKDAKLFQDLIKLDMNKIVASGILNPIAGIILNLTLATPKSEQTHFEHSFATEMAKAAWFNIDNLHFLRDSARSGLIIGKKKNEKKKKKNARRLILIALFDTFDSIKKEINFEKLNKAIEEIKEAKSEEKNSLVHSSSIEFCPICCSAPIDTVFIPCKHRSCNMCIKRQLLNVNRCFFCNAVIQDTKLEEPIPKEKEK